MSFRVDGDDGGHVWRIPFAPPSWTSLSDAERARWENCDHLITIALSKPRPGYSQMSSFSVPLANLPIRETIREWIKTQPRHSYMVGQEWAALESVDKSALYTQPNGMELTAYRVFARLMQAEPISRTTPLSISYLPWLRLAPVPRDSPFHWYTPQTTEPAIFRALLAYLVVITAHPFKDGNGRVARIIFNAYLKKSDPASAYFPLSDVLMAGNGQFEEYLAVAGVTGDYTELLHHMRYMATGYAQFIIDGGGKIEGDEDQFAQAIADASRNLVAEDAISVRPLIIAKEWLFRSKFPERNWHFVNQIHGISEELGQLVKIEYAVTRLSDLRSSVRSPIPLLMAVTTDSTAELLVRARMIKAKFPDIVLRIALITDDAVINARLVLGFSLLEPLVGASDLVLLTGLQLANTPS